MTLTKSEIIADESRFQQVCSAYVGRNVLYCLSSLMWQIGQDIERAAKLFDEDLDDMLSWFIIQDWQEPVLELINDADLDDLERITDMVGYWSDVLNEAGAPEGCEAEEWVEAHPEALSIIREKVEDLITNDDEYREIAEDFRLDPYECEVYEHWLVDGYFARELEEFGERTFSFCNMTIWARCTTGQSISLDGVIRRIVKGLDENHWAWREA